MNSLVLRISSVVMFLAMSVPILAADFGPAPRCDVRNQDSDGRVIDCRFQLNGDTKVSAAALSLDGELTPSQWQRFGGSGEGSAVLFLIDTSNPKHRVEAVKAAAGLVRSWADFASSKFLIGVAAFDSQLTSLVAPQSTKEAVIKATEDLKAKGMTTELYRGVLNALEKFDEVPSERKHLVVLSDGLAEDTAYTHDDVILAAQNAGIVVHGIGYPLNTSKSTGLQTLRRMAEETGGSYWQASANNELETGFNQRLLDTFKSGGTVSAALPEGTRDRVSVSMGVDLIDGRHIETVLDVPIPEASFSPWYLQRKYQIGGGVGVVLLLALLALVLRRKTTEEPVGEGVSYGYLQQVDAVGTRHAVVNRTCRIGRNSDCDVQLMNDSVSGYHADLLLDRDGGISIVDLGSTNGLRVNGDEVHQATVNDGDEIELGEVRLRFESAQ
ncbi:MAG: FHA domain-containing protein [Gammaproteobacteria bacterium]|nr:FHA domain-containing protein [Gammaproteobacteria bacterium]MCP5136469.1 FHA domain-containing protein [Gammaproteobacteria bacterium]